MRGCLKELERFFNMYIDMRSLTLVREEPRAFASRMFEVFSLLLFPSTEETFLQGVKGKALHSLWRIITDDTLYTPSGKDNIFDSLQVVTKYKNGMNCTGKTVSGQIMHDFFQQFYNLSSGPNRKIAEELLYLDLVRILNGFDHKRIAKERDTVTTLSEYMEFGAVTIDLRVYLDIDIALYPYNMDVSTIGDLREAYKWVSLAFKLHSDIAAFEREFFVEKTHNAVVLCGQEKGVLPRDVLRADTEYKERVCNCVIPALVVDLENKGRNYLSRSIECLEKINEIDMSDIAEAFKTLVENDGGHNPFPHLVT